MSKSRMAHVEKRRIKAILEAVDELFTVGSYEATNMDQIVQRVGVSKGTLYRCFRSKEEILAALLGHKMGELAAAIQEECADVDVDADAPETLLALTRVLALEYAFFARYNPLLFTLLRCDEHKISPERMADIRRGNQARHDWLVRLLERGMEQQVIKPGAAEHMAWGLEYAVKGFAMMKTEDCRPEGEEDKLLPLLLELMWHGVLREQEPKL